MPVVRHTLPQAGTATRADNDAEWRAIQAHIPAALEDVADEMRVLFGAFIEHDDQALAFINEAKRRYDRGRREHEHADSTWASWSDQQFIDNIREEFIDMVIYAAARRVARIKAASA